jgi:hypothetical protein
MKRETTETSKTKDKVQFNFRVTEAVHKRVKMLAAEAGYHMNDIGEDLVRFVLGSRDKSLIKRLNDLAELARRRGYDN